MDVFPPGPYHIRCPNVPGHSLSIVDRGGANSVQLTEDGLIKPAVWFLEYIAGAEAVIRAVDRNNVGVPSNDVWDFRGGVNTAAVANRLTDLIVYPRHSAGTNDENQRWLLLPEGPLLVRIRSVAESDNNSNFVTVQRCRPDRANPIAMNAEPGRAEDGPEPVVGERWSLWEFIPFLP